MGHPNGISRASNIYVPILQDCYTSALGLVKFSYGPTLVGFPALNIYLCARPIGISCAPHIAMCPS